MFVLKFITSVEQAAEYFQKPKGVEKKIITYILFKSKKILKRLFKLTF